MNIKPCCDGSKVLLRRGGIVHAPEKWPGALLPGAPQSSAYIPDKYASGCGTPGA